MLVFVVFVLLLIWSIAKGCVFEHKIIKFPSKCVTCHAQIHHDPLVSHVEIAFRHM